MFEETFVDYFVHFYSNKRCSTREKAIVLLSENSDIFGIFSAVITEEKKESF